MKEARALLTDPEITVEDVRHRLGIGHDRRHTAHLRKLETAVFEEHKPPPSGPPLNEAFRVREYHLIAVMLDAVGATAPPRAHRLEFFAAVAPQLPLFHRLMELCNKNEMNGLCA